MKITVVTVCYNAVKEIEETIMSVIGQTYPNVEYIVIDGGSTDGTIDIIKRYEDRITHWISEPDKGIYDAMNKGIRLATGDYINFMNAGDRFVDKEVLSQVAKTGNGATILYGDTRMHERGVVYDAVARDLSILKERMPFCHQSTFISVPYHQKNLFNVSFKCSADYNFFYNSCYRDSVSFQHLPFMIADYEAMAGFSKDNLSKTYRERYRIWGIENSWIQTLPWEIKLIYRRMIATIKEKMPNKLLASFRS